MAQLQVQIGVLRAPYLLLTPQYPLHYQSLLWNLIPFHPLLMLLLCRYNRDLPSWRYSHWDITPSRARETTPLMGGPKWRGDHYGTRPINDLIYGLTSINDQIQWKQKNKNSPSVAEKWRVALGVPPKLGETPCLVVGGTRCSVVGEMPHLVGSFPKQLDSVP